MAICFLWVRTMITEKVKLFQKWKLSFPPWTIKAPPVNIPQISENAKFTISAFGFMVCSSLAIPPNFQILQAEIPCQLGCRSPIRNVGLRWVFYQSLRSPIVILSPFAFGLQQISNGSQKGLQWFSDKKYIFNYSIFAHQFQNAGPVTVIFGPF